jgi:hypothetical protein
VTAYDLAGALNVELVDEPLFRAAGDLLVVLIDSPFKGIDDYAAAPQVAQRYMQLAMTQASDLHDFIAIAAIRRFLADSEGDPWRRRYD